MRLGGSGAALPLARALARPLSSSSAGARWVVEESLGSGGGLLAAHDGAIDGALVSRDLTDAERALGLELVPLAVDAVVLAAHLSVPVGGLTGDEVRALYAGRLLTFPDGSPATVRLRDRGESANAVLERLLPGLTASRPAARRFPVQYYEGSQLEALAAAPGAVGVTSLAVLREAVPRLKVLSLDGLEATQATLEDGRWPATRSITLAFRVDRRERLGPLLSLLATAEGAALVRAAGYRPAPRPP